MAHDTNWPQVTILLAMGLIPEEQQNSSFVHDSGSLKRERASSPDQCFITGASRPKSGSRRCFDWDDAIFSISFFFLDFAEQFDSSTSIILTSHYEK